MRPSASIVLRDGQGLPEAAKPRDASAVPGRSSHLASDMRRAQPRPSRTASKTTSSKSAGAML